jgi:hypothetical protein
LAGHDAHFARAGEGQRDAVHVDLGRTGEHGERNVQPLEAVADSTTTSVVTLSPMAGKSIVCGPPVASSVVTEAVAEFSLGQPPSPSARTRK